MALRKWWTTVRDSLWFVPTIWVVISAVLAFAMIALDSAMPDIAARFPLVFGGGADGARGLLSSIAGSMITVAGVTFSITIVALQLASSQFSPRVIRSFMRDRANQVVLGSFIGAFTYSMLVLRSIRVEEVDSAAFVPSIAVSVAIAYALLALGMLVYFIHHIATRIQISTVVASIADETSQQIARGWPDHDNPPEPTSPSEPVGTVVAHDSGYLQLIDIDALVGLATRHRLVVRLDVRSGAWVQRGAPLFSVWPANATDDGLADALCGRVSLGDQRSIEQDAPFGLRQLVDIAVKAISPGINDPTSATNCIDRIGQILVAAGNRHPPAEAHYDDDGGLRLIVPHLRWDGLVDLGFDQLRQYSRGSCDISLALATALRTTALAVPAERRAALQRQARLIGEQVDAIPIPEDGERVREALARVPRA